MKREIGRVGVVVVAAAVVAAIAVGFVGCSSTERPDDAGLVASSGSTHASVSVPDGEPASVGSYELVITLLPEGESDGSRQAITGKRDGTMSGVWVDDVTGDGAPDVVVSMSSAGSGSYGSCHVYARSGRVFEQVELAALTGEQRNGFMGHDSFRVADESLYREFPVYASDDPNARPSGGVLGYRYDFETAAWVEP